MIKASARCVLVLVLTALRPAIAQPTTPVVFWASDPVRPDETVLLQGGDLGEAAVETARLEDDGGGEPEKPAEIKHWTGMSVLQGSPSSLKFALPADWKMGIVACRVRRGKALSATIFLNVPDPWWIQGDEGATATAGGWLRVFGKSLHFGPFSAARLQPEQGKPVPLVATSADCYALRFVLPADLKPGRYAVAVQNGFGGASGWRSAGTIRVEPPSSWPAQRFSVLEFYGANSEAEMRKTLIKYNSIPDRTAGIQAAIQKAKANGGGIVYFPAGRYGIKGPIDVPPRTVLQGEGTGLAVLWWGSGRFNLDGGGQQGLARDAAETKPPVNLITGREFAIEDMSLYFPLEHQTAITAGDRFRMRRVRIRIDHYWTLDGSRRPEGTIARLGKNFAVTDCDIVAKGTGLVPGQYGLVARNRILAGKTHCPLGGAREVIVEDNEFVSTYPTAYMNIAGEGRNLYYARNRQEAMQAHQADYSFTFDAGTTAYYGKIATVDGARLTLAADPTYAPWAAEKSELWRKAAVCILDGRGAGQWRNVVSNRGRQWQTDRPFDCPPDASSIVTIVPFNGRVLVVGNRFEDANWVNAGYGTSIDAIYAGNRLYRCAQLLNYGLASKGDYQPCWHTQYLDNEAHEGLTTMDTTGSVRDAGVYGGPITCCTIHRRPRFAEDNSGGIGISGRVQDAIVEEADLRHPMNAIRVDADAKAVLLRNNRFLSDPHITGSGLREAVIIGEK